MLDNMCTTLEYFPFAFKQKKNLIRNEKKTRLIRIYIYPVLGFQL